MRVAIGCDHVGFASKEPIVEALQQEGHAVLDLGTYATAPVDYPPLVRAVVNAVLNRFVDVGILITERGTGAAMAANKFKGIRAAYCPDAATARASREHEDSNVLCLGGRGLDAAAALDVARQWLGTQFSNDPTDARSLAQLAEMDQGLGAAPAPAPSPRPQP
ncbi:MAG: RpiB/LacA/LacB family sugar-phosphate isomerase, partial [Candidatus Rokuibacteriota bacterium]